EVRYWLAGNLCRCTGYDKIVSAVLDAAATMRKGERWPRRRTGIPSTSARARSGLTPSTRARAPPPARPSSTRPARPSTPCRPTPQRALKATDVTYEVLPHVIDVVDAMPPGAPRLHDHLFTAGVEPKPDKPPNVAKRVEITLGDIDAGFKKADVIVEREFKTAPVHQGYIEPHAAVGSVSEDGVAELWCTTQGHFIVRAHCAKLLGMDIGKIRVTATEIGGGFGGKTVVYLEP